MLARLANWLIPEASPLVLGIHFAEHHLSLAALRTDPLRLVAVARQGDHDDAVIDDEIRLTSSLAADVAGLCRSLRIPPGTPTVAAIQPATNTVTVLDGGVDARLGPGPDGGRRGEADPVPVHPVSAGRMGEVVAGASLELIGVDPVPLGLARLGRRFGTPTLVAHPGSRWEVFVGPDSVEGCRTRPGVASTPGADGDGLRIGPDGRPPAPVATIPGIEVPGPLAEAVDLGRDALAIAAALAGLGYAPLPVIETPAPALIDGWDIQPVQTLDRAEGGIR